MGSSNPHPHCQIWATGHVPDEPLAEGAAQLDYLERMAAHCWQTIWRRNSRRARAWSARMTPSSRVVPYWAIWPFETIVLPRRKLR